jgi:hypothetical protein
VPQEILDLYDIPPPTGQTVDIPLSAAVPLPSMGLEPNYGSSVPSPTAEMIAADTAATAGGIPEGSYAPMGGGPLAIGANLLNPLNQITGGNPIFGENGLIPPSDPYTIEDFMRDQAEMDRGPENREPALVAAPEVLAPLAPTAPAAPAAPAAPEFLGLGQMGAVPYVSREDVAFGPQYQMTLDQYMEMLRRFPGGSGSTQLPGLAPLPTYGGLV